MEIIIKTKQTFNAHFSFLHYADRLFPYYKHLLKVIASGEYVPAEETRVENGGGDTAGMIEDSKTREEEGEDDEEEEDDDEDNELHPLLRGSLGTSSSSSSGVTISSPLVLAGRRRAGGKNAGVGAPLLPVHSSNSDAPPSDYSFPQTR